MVEIPFITVAPKAAHTHTVVFLHGRGGNARNFAGSLYRWRDSRSRTIMDAFPSFRWVFPQAPLSRCSSSPQIWNQWFDVWNVRNFAEREELAIEGLKQVIPPLRTILANEAAALGGRWDRVILAGISMGAATSVHMLFNLDVPPNPDGVRRLAAFIGFSARCPLAGRSLEEMRSALSLDDVPAHNEVLQNTPMLLEHCANDPLVWIPNGRRLRDILSEFGAQIEWKEYQAGGHWFNSPRGMDDAVAFLNQQVLGMDNGNRSKLCQVL